MHTGEEIKVKILSVDVDRERVSLSRKALLPDERIGLCMIFKTYDRLSFALTLKASREVRVGDMVLARIRTSAPLQIQP